MGVRLDCDRERAIIKEYPLFGLSQHAVWIVKGGSITTSSFIIIPAIWIVKGGGAAM